VRQIAVARPDGLGSNNGRREERSWGYDYCSHARVTAGYAMVAGREVRWAEGCGGSRALHRWLQLCSQDDGSQTYHQKIILKSCSSCLLSCAFVIPAIFLDSGDSPFSFFSIRRFSAAAAPRVLEKPGVLKPAFCEPAPHKKNGCSITHRC